MMYIMSALLFRQQTTDRFVYITLYGDDDEDELVPEIAGPLLEPTAYERLADTLATHFFSIIILTAKGENLKKLK